jgi:hypothetical protein
MGGQQMKFGFGHANVTFKRKNGRDRYFNLREFSTFHML